MSLQKYGIPVSKEKGPWFEKRLHTAKPIKQCELCGVSPSLLQRQPQRVSKSDPA